MTETTRAARGIGAWWRTVHRGVLIVLTTFLWWLVLMTGLGIARLRPRWRTPVRRFVLRYWARSTLFLAGGRREVVGAPPPNPGLLVTNHLSYADVLLLASEVPGRFVAKSEISDWPIVGSLCRAIGVIFVDRGSRRDTARVARQMERVLCAGETVILFPEGTSTSGHSVLPFRAPLLAPAAEAGLPVSFAALRYETQAADPPAFLSIAWWGDAPLFPHLPHLLGLRPYAARIQFGDEALRDDDRKRLAASLRDRISELFEPMVDYEPHSPDDPRPRREVEGGERVDRPDREARLSAV